MTLDYRLMNAKEGVDNRPAGYVRAQFQYKDIEDVAATEKAGHRVTKRVEWVVLSIGDGPTASKTQHHVTDEDRNRYPAEYDAFKRNLPEVVSGTPLAELPGIPPHMVDACKSAGVRSIEALADCGDPMLDRIGTGARALKESAVNYLSSAHKEIDRLRRADEEKDRKLQEMQEQIAALQATHARKAAKAA